MLFSYLKRLTTPSVIRGFVCVCGISSLCRGRVARAVGGHAEISTEAVFPTGECDVLGSILLLAGGLLKSVYSCYVEQNSPFPRIRGKSPHKPVTIRIYFGQG